VSDSNVRVDSDSEPASDSDSDSEQLELDSSTSAYPGGNLKGTARPNVVLDTNVRFSMSCRNTASWEFRMRGVNLRYQDDEGVITDSLSIMMIDSDSDSDSELELDSELEATSTAPSRTTSPNFKDNRL
jgi:hypothetical protein